MKTTNLFKRSDGQCGRAYEPMLAERGLLRAAPLGDSFISCVSERDARELYLDLLRQSPNFFIQEPFSAQHTDKTFVAHNMVAL